MLTIRMQRTGRKGHTQYRVVVQDSRFTPTSGRVVAYLGSYDPHNKTTTIDKEKATGYLVNGAQPSDRVVRLLKTEGVKLPSWVKESTPRSRTIRNEDKLRRNRPAEEKTPEAPAAPEAEAPESPAEEAAEPSAQADPEPSAEPESAPTEPDAAEDAPAEEPAAEAPAKTDS